MGKASCRGCEKRKPKNGRGLCEVCMRTPEISTQYPGNQRSKKESARLRRRIDKLATGERTYQQIGDILGVSKQLVQYYVVQLRNNQECNACRQVRKIKCRGLCHSCYAQPGIKERFARDRKFSPRGDASKPTFSWSNDPGLYPCDRCVREAAIHPRGLCPNCFQICPDWQPKVSTKRPLELCQETTTVGL